MLSQRRGLLNEQRRDEPRIALLESRVNVILLFGWIYCKPTATE
jgi:hypothetical protein